MGCDNTADFEFREGAVAAVAMAVGVPDGERAVAAGDAPVSERTAVVN